MGLKLSGIKATYKNMKKILILFLLFFGISNTFALSKDEKLYNACLSDTPNLKEINALIKSGADVNAKFEIEEIVFTPLFAALHSEKPNIDVITTLIKSGADVNHNCNNGLTPLIYAMVIENSEIFNAFINAGADLDMINIPGKNIKMLRTEVTQALYFAVMADKKTYKPNHFEEDNLSFPAENVSWYDAIEFCNELSIRMGLTPVYTINGFDVTWNHSATGFHLPTEEEWEYAAQGGDNYRYSGSNNVDEVAWYSGNSEGKTHPVALKKPNGYGLYDMSGNVSEWCWDVDLEDRFICSIRGGSYSYSDAEGLKCQVYYRDRDSMLFPEVTIGFRIVRNK